jgi:hypothetical protein
MLADLIDCADIRVMQCGSSLRFPAKSFQHLLVVGLVSRSELQDNESVELDVLSHEHDTNTAATEFSMMR